MKRIVAYVHPMRVHWLVEELNRVGITEMVVTEYFNARGQISKFELLCNDCLVEGVSKIVHTIGTMGSMPDHYIEVMEFDGSAADSIALGHRISTLEKGSQQ